MNKIGLRFHLVWVLCLLALPASAVDPYDGVYVATIDEIDYHLTLEADNFGRYDGIFTTDGEKQGLEARRFGDRLAGRIIGPGGQKPVTLELRGVNLLLLSFRNGTTLRLLRVLE